MNRCIDQEKTKKNAGSSVLLNYSGPSVNPTFKAGDELTALPYEKREIRSGDVIVFRSSESGRNVVHRVVRVDLEGINTRGDNNILDDILILGPENIIGRVVSANCSQRNLNVHGGRTGTMIAVILRVRKRIG